MDVTTLAKARTITEDDKLRALLDNELITEDGGLVAPTFSTKNRKLSAEQLSQLWHSVLPAPANEIFAAVSKHASSQPISVERLAALTNRQPRGGSWNNAIATLKANSLIVERDKGSVMMAPDQR